MSEAIKNLFTDISPTYDKLNHLLSFNIDKSWRRKTIAKIQRQPNETFLALDLCAGTHDLGLECLKKFPKAKVIAADFSFGMLAQGQDKLKLHVADQKIFPVCADALHMPFEDNTFDVAFCAFGMRNLDNKSKGLEELNRVLKPGGQLMILEFFKADSLASRFFNKTFAQHIMPRIGRLVSGHQSAYDYLRDSIRGFLTVDDFRELMIMNGYKDIGADHFLMSIASCMTGVKKPI
jgi:demethylmenaquinone methyltransferase/2-methoxy-6-polyprenyl-1,4-benzoquinol methylase